LTRRDVTNGSPNPEYRDELDQDSAIITSIVPVEKYCSYIIISYNGKIYEVVGMFSIYYYYYCFQFLICVNMLLFRVPNARAFTPTW